ncbi:uncharacterized protein LOC129916475 isoform X2 [Episyrphus balteatus]|uniref:uncharacterized protein LOC129916475 isoform X2 n=1 Tax=Episyrphus balteatus TaxID=286459 RepID=UPI0024869FA4|nr:uncharacterized protein LOC129916475 isoform X2 [Episyrphus balteatus]
MPIPCLDVVFSGKFLKYPVNDLGSLLRALNDSFTLIADSTELATKQSFQVVKPNNSKSNVFRDLQLVHDFVQKTIHLCITHYPGDDYFDGVIDLSKFRSLKRLEVQRTNIKQIVGIQPLRSQLQQLVCVRSLQSVVEIITHCGGDRSNGFVWNELKTADFSYNNLNTIDSSLEFAQYLQHLNLRHNQLVSVEAIKWLPNLKTLDLSYNRLTMVPNFHVETTKRLQCLNLSNNFLEDLIGVSKLDLLTELDLSNNCLLDHNALYPLSALVTLKYLNLYGNPLYYHPKHRLATAQFLHKDTCTVKFILNCESLTKSEKVLTGTHQHNNHCGYVVKYMANSNSRPTPCKDPSLNQTPASSEGSKKNYKSFAIADDEGVGMTSSITEKSKRVKVRQVVIECPEQINNGTVALTESENTTTNLKINKDHLETKKQFNILRNKYGAGWLQNENAHIVDNVLGLSPSNTTTVNSDTKITPHQILYDYLGEISSTDLNVNTNAIVKKTTYVNLLEEISSDSLSKNADVSEYISAFSNISNDVENKKPVYLTDEEQEVAEPLDIAPHLENIYYVNTVDELELSDPETDEETFIVYTLEKKEPILLTVSPNCIREKDASNHKSIMTKAKWSLKILESCDRIKSNMLRINFDTVKMDKKERVYTIEEQSCQELEKKLRAILSKRNLFEMNQKVYRCINCNCQFSKENSLNNHRKQGVFCPDCKSTFVTEIHNLPPSLNKTSTTTPKFVQEIAVEVINMEIKKKESPMFSISSTHEEKRDSMGEPDNSMHGSDARGPSRLTANNKFSRSLMQSLQQSSINSLNESSSCSKISHSQGSFDSNQSVVGSSAADRENDFKSNCESDVDIISNPSQSSIEVIDHIHTSRKNSEDRRISQSSNLEIITDCFNYSECQEDAKFLQSDKNKIVEETKNKIPSEQILLTESSSSGSVTDSVCTTYDQRNLTPAKVLLDERKNVPKIQLPVEETIKKEESKFSTMFGGLLQSTNMLMSRTTQRFVESELSSLQCEKYNFNYTDFSDVDHRLKFYFYQMKFEEQSEHFKWIVKGKLYNENTGTIIDGIVVMSTLKCYVMEEFGPENDNVSKWLRPVVSVTADRLESIRLLPWKVGISFALRDWGNFLLLLQDILRTDSLLFYFTTNALPDQCKLDYTISEKVLNRLANTVENEKLNMFSLLNSCEVNLHDKVETFIMPGLFTTNSRLFLSATNPSWLTPTTDVAIEVGLTQFMSNLVEVERPEENIFSLHFHDETKNITELWKCRFETKENAESCLNAIGQSWEKLFGVSLFNN